MKHEPDHIIKLREMYENTEGKPLSVEIDKSIRSIQNYLSYKQEPGKEVIKRIHEAFAKFKKGEELGIKNPDQTDQDYKDKYIYALEELDRIRRKEIEEIRENLSVLLESVKALGASQFAYQKYWADHFPPKGKTSAQVTEDIRKKANEVLLTFSSGGIRL
jgi:hypothetical protein